MTLQEKYKEDPWRVLVACILLNLTSRQQVDLVIDRLFYRWPTPGAMWRADQEEVQALIRPLGLWRRRSKTLKKMSREFILAKLRTNHGTLPEEEVKNLPGVGPYALDSYRIFVLGDESRCDSKDRVLMEYLARA